MTTATLAFGIGAAVLCVAQALYPLRRALMARPFGTAARALSFHVYSSAAMGALVVAHAGVRWPPGWLGRALLVLSAWTIAGGAIGVLIQRVVPRRLLALDVARPKGGAAGDDAGAAGVAGDDAGTAGAARARAARLLRLWPLLHVPPAAALTALVLWHAFGVLYY